MPIPKAISKLAIPCIFSQLITLIYNMADTFFVGRTGDTYQVAAVSMSFTLYFLISAVGGLYGIGGGSLISRYLGAKRTDMVRKTSAFSFYMGLATTAVLCIVLLIFMRPILILLGASENTYDYCHDYLIWVDVIGGLPTAATIIMVDLLRSEGYTKQASIGASLGGILNIILDPIFIFALKLGVTGAAIATFISNCVSCCFFIIRYYTLRDKTVISINPKYIAFDREMVKQVYFIGLPTFISTCLASVTNTVSFNMLSKYGDIPVSAFGITKKLDMVPMCFCMGISNGALPLIAYNYASGERKRMRKAVSCAMMVAVVFGLLYLIAGSVFNEELVRFFIDHDDTVLVGSGFVAIECLGTPIVAINNIINVTYQAMGKGFPSLILSCCRNAIVKIPAAIILEGIVGLNGILWSQFASDALMLIPAVLLLLFILKRTEKQTKKA